MANTNIMKATWPIFYDLQDKNLTMFAQYTAGLGGMGANQPRAMTMHGGVCLVVDANPRIVPLRIPWTLVFVSPDSGRSATIQKTQPFAATTQAVNSP
jgi:urocanate hydratase